MKLWKRILSAVLLFAVGMVGFEFPEIQGQSALAEYVPYGSTNVPETPGSLRTSGEWLYWLDGEYAIIAGYANESERTLKIPAHLSGHSVIGIGHQAFANNAALRSVQMHNNITRIAEDAFEKKTNVTIKAYNGSFALWYAGKMGLGWDNLSKSSRQTFTDAVIDMSGAPSKSYYNLSEDGVTVSLSDATNLRESGIVYFPPS